jgi:ATP-dependent protease ClpP protease subunit
MRFLILTLSFFMMISNTYSMTYAIEEPDGKPNYCSWIISGDISKDEFVFAEEIFKKHLNKCKQTSGWISLTINLDSPGGDVDAAMSIGRFLRKYGVRTTVRENSKCISSCVFIFMAGLERTVNRENTIGVHRPYFVDLSSQISINEIQNIRRKRIESIKNYLNEMDIPISLVDLMMAIPPNDIKLLSNDDMKAYRINQADPAWEEKQNSINASIYGLTSSEFRRLNAISSDVCIYRSGALKYNAQDSETVHNCSQAILWNLSVEKYKQRYQVVQKKCFGSQDENLIVSCMRGVFKAP